MEYTKADIDKILEASKKATSESFFVGDIDSSAIVMDSPRGLVAYRIIPTNDDKPKPEDMILFAGAQILAEEVKRLRIENEKLLNNNKVVEAVKLAHREINSMIFLYDKK